MRKPSVKINILYQMLYEVLALALPLITTPYISRILGAEKIGIYSYTYSIAYYFGLVAMLGVKNHGNREIAKNRYSKESIERTFSSIYAIQLICSGAVILCFVMSIPRMDETVRPYYAIQIGYIISCALDINWFFWGLEQFKITVLGNSIIKLCNFIAIFIFVRSSSDLWKYCVIMSLCCVASQLIMWGYFLRNYKIRPTSRESIYSHLKPMLLLFIPVVAVSLFNVMDKIMVGSISSKAQLGYYENAEKITNCVKTVITSFGTVLMPRMAKLVNEKDDKQRKYYMSMSSEVIFFIAFGLCFGLAAVSNHFAPIFFGNDFSPCGPLMVGLAFSLPFSAFANFVRTQFLIPNNKDKEYIVAVLVGALLNVIVNVRLIPSLNAMGAVIGTIVAEGAVCVTQCVLVRNKLNVKYYIKKALPYLMIGIVMLLSISCINSFTNPTVLCLIEKIVFGAAEYGLCSALYWYLSKNEVWDTISGKIKTLLN